MVFHFEHKQNFREFNKNVSYVCLEKGAMYGPGSFLSFLYSNLNISKLINFLLKITFF